MKHDHTRSDLKFFLSIVGVGLLLVAAQGSAQGDSLECESIKDSDQRNYCRALANKQKILCEFIKDADLRHRCRALAELK